MSSSLTFVEGSKEESLYAARKAKATQLRTARRRQTGRRLRPLPGVNGATVTCALRRALPV